MKPYRIDKDVQSNIEPVVSFYADYVRNPINIKIEKRDYMGMEETIYVYDEELWTLAEWNIFNDKTDILQQEVDQLKQINAGLLYDSASSKIEMDKQKQTDANMLLEIALLKGGL